MNIRIANKEDIQKLKDLDAKEPIFVEELNEYHFLLEDNEFLNFFLESKSIFIIESDSKIYGFLLAQIREWMFHQKKIIWIEHILIDPERRREGIAQSLLKYMIRHYIIEDPSICNIYGNISPHNKASLKMSEKFAPTYLETLIVSKRINNQ